MGCSSSNTINEQNQSNAVPLPTRPVNVAPVRETTVISLVNISSLLFLLFFFLLFSSF